MLRGKAISLHPVRSILPLPVLFRTGSSVADRRPSWEGKKGCGSRENCCRIWQRLCCGSPWQSWCVPCVQGPASRFPAAQQSLAARKGTWHRGVGGMCLPEGAVCPEEPYCRAAGLGCSLELQSSPRRWCCVQTFGLLQQSPGLGFVYWLVVTWLIMDHFYSWLLGKLISLSTVLRQKCIRRYTWKWPYASLEEALYSHIVWVGHIYSTSSWLWFFVDGGWSRDTSSKCCPHETSLFWQEL